MKHVKSSHKLFFLGLLTFVSTLTLFLTAESSSRFSANLFNLSLSDLTAFSFFRSYYMSEPVYIRLKNNAVHDIIISAPIRFRVLKKNGNTFDPVFTSREFPSITIRPGKVYEWRWNQKTTEGGAATPGEHKVEFLFYDSPEPVLFKINTETGSNGFVTFSFGGHKETMRVLLKNPTALRRAIISYYKRGSFHIVQGPLVDDRNNASTNGKNPYDPQWSWHLSPTSTQMVSAALELCDGLPTFVEREIDYWVYTVKKFCPWGGRVTSLK